MESVKKWISHNQGMTFALLILVAVMVWGLGCEAKVLSLDPRGGMVSIDQFEIEVAAAVKRLEVKIEQLISTAELCRAQFVKAQAGKKALLEFAAITAASGGFNVTGLIPIVGTILGLGAVADNRIKDKVIKNRPMKV